MKEIKLPEKAKQEFDKLYLDYASKAATVEAAKIAVSDFIRSAKQALNIPSNWSLNIDGSAFIGQED